MLIATRLQDRAVDICTVGRGVFAGRDIPAGTVIDVCPVLILDPQENKDHIEKTSLYHYTYNWPLPDRNGKSMKTQAVVFGLGSLFNHSTPHQNVGWKRDLERQVVVYKALRDIGECEELCISYGSHLTFEDVEAARSSSSSSDIDENEMLGKILLE